MEIIRKEYTVPSKSGVADIYARCWMPADGVKAIFQISHGMAEHGERYEDFASFLCGNGFAHILASMDSISPPKQIFRGEMRSAKTGNTYSCTRMRVFFHPDFHCRSWNCTMSAFRRADCTAGREFHPTLKIRMDL